MIQEIGIVDSKKAISVIKEKYNFDFSNYAPTAFKRRLIKYINGHNFNNIKDFLVRLEEDERIFEQLYEEVLVEETEMFRDPPLWRELREKFLPELIGNRDMKIWIASSVSGDEIFTTAIVLNEIGLLNNVKIIASVPSDKYIEKIKSGGGYDLKKMEIGEANYLRFFGKFNFTKYYKVQNNKAFLNDDLLKNTEFKKHNILSDEPFSTYKLVFCRNQLIYCNPNMHETVSKKLFDSLMPGGYLVIGGKETLDGFTVDKKLNLVNKTEKIYKRRLS
jgi:chemotaxis protein methyltransferase CheR